MTLVNIVSPGGNLLLDIGPNANGKIPPIMQGILFYKSEKWLK
ncbi:alpha-L-fucosidase [Bacteroides fragilis]|nr:alpha-L-fucosidase [Bacteroides fragilis]